METIDKVIKLTEKKLELLKEYKTAIQEEKADIVVDNHISDNRIWLVAFNRKNGNLITSGSDKDVFKYLKKTRYKNMKVFVRPINK